MTDDFHVDAGLIQAAQALARIMREQEFCLYLTGLAASGKTAAAEIISRMTGVPVVDSGLVFRLAAYLCVHVPVAAENPGVLARLLGEHTIKVVNGQYRILSGDSDITERLQAPDVGSQATATAAEPRLREVILTFLRSRTKAPAIVAARGVTEPLTTGNFVQIELRADLEVRAARRAKQSGSPVATIRKSIRARDDRDQRGPSRYPSADFVDSSKLTLHETVARVVERTTARISRLLSISEFRKVEFNNAEQLSNPLLVRLWAEAQAGLEEEESTQGIPKGHAKARFLLNLSRYSSLDLLGLSHSWMPGALPGLVDTAAAVPANDLLMRECARTVEERAKSIRRFMEATRFPSAIFDERSLRLELVRGRPVGTSEGGEVVEHYHLRDTSPEVGMWLENNLHYLGAARLDTTHRVALVEASSEFPVLYLSFAPNTRKYMEPLLWRVGLRLEEVAVAVRGYGTPRCPRNAMAWFLREACARVKQDFPHLRAVVTDINPNWGFSGSSFQEAGFVTLGMKYAPTSFVAGDYSPRRSLERQPGSRAAVGNRLPLVPTLVMIRPFPKESILRTRIAESVVDGVYLIPRDLYEEK